MRGCRPSPGSSPSGVAAVQGLGTVPVSPAVPGLVTVPGVAAVPGLVTVPGLPAPLPERGPSDRLTSTVF